MKKKNLPEPESRAWIFQVNPDVFDIDRYLTHGQGTLSWEIDCHADEINDGDTVYIWRQTTRSARERAAATSSHPFSRAARQARRALKAGIVAVARVNGSVFNGLDDSDGPGFRSDLALPEHRDRIQIDIVEKADGRTVVRREWLMSDPICHDMSILDRSTCGIIKVEPHHAGRVADLWKNAGRPMTRTDVVAILDCWITLKSLARLEGRRLPSVPAEKRALDRQSKEASNQALFATASLIGRAVGSVRLAVSKMAALDPESTASEIKGASPLFRQVISEFIDGESERLNDRMVKSEFRKLFSAGPAPATGHDDPPEGLLL